jgi:2-dehydro-3-deoxygluconokinase
MSAQRDERRHFDVVTFGEGQLRYSVPIGHRLENVSAFDVHACGTEANVVGLLSRLGWRTGWVSALPNTPLGKRVAAQFRLAGMDLSSVVWRDGGRLATYYVEYAVPPRSTQVYYDRADTCFTNLTKADIDWDYFADSRILHLSGLSLPLSASVAEIMREAIKRAKAASRLVTFDLNYRRRLWSAQAAREAIGPLLGEIDVLFCGRGDAKAVFGFDGEPQQIVEQLARLTSASFIVVSLSEQGVIGWDGGNFLSQPAVRVQIVDRIGAGDAMVAGVLHGILQNDFARGLRYGVHTAALALSQFGDQVVTDPEELENLVKSSATPDIYR